MTRKELLQAAMDATTDRGDTYGKPEDNFAVIARLWRIYLGVPVNAHDVAMMMVLFKVARDKANPGHTDNLVDIAGYAACAAELGAGNENGQRYQVLALCCGGNPGLCGVYCCAFVFWPQRHCLRKVRQE